MNCQFANSISLIDILHNQGHKKVHSRVSNGIIYCWFYSPFREERTASFSVNTTTNTFYDFGTSEHGTVIDYITKYYQCSISEALKKLRSLNFSSFTKQKLQAVSIPIETKVKSSYKILLVSSIQNEYLKLYLHRRKISKKYWHYLKEVHFTLKEQKYYAVGFLNESNGYDLSWEYWNKEKSNFERIKLCLYAKDITHIKRGSSNVAILESWSDFLALLTLYPKMEDRNDFIIMNSVTTKDKVFQTVKANNYKTIYSATDNDSAGNRILKQLFFEFGDTVIPLNHLYMGYKDLNDFLLSEKKYYGF